MTACEAPESQGQKENHEGGKKKEKVHYAQRNIKRYRTMGPAVKSDRI